MNVKNDLIGVGMCGLLATGTLALAIEAAAQHANEPKAQLEKCYGVVKAGKNDCAGPGHGCHGKATADAHPAEFILLPAGTCERLVNGSLEKGE